MSRKILNILVLSLILPIIAQAQCKEYIKSIAPEAVEPYVMDGNFFSPVVYEGEEIVLTRTFLAGQKYKVAVLGMDLFEKQITVKDADGFIVFKNYKIRKSEKAEYYTDYEGYKMPCLGSHFWEFELEESQNLTIIVQLERKARRRKDRLRGCLGIVIGFLS